MRSSFVKSSGTAVCGEKGKRIVSGIASDRDTALITITGLVNKPGAAFGVFKLLAERGISVDIILGSGENGGEIAFTVERKNLKAVTSALKANLKAGTIKWDEGFSKISIIGAGLETNPGVASELFGALAEENINVEMITTSEIKISLLINRKDEEKAVRVLHKKFIEKYKA